MSSDPNINILRLRLTALRVAFCNSSKCKGGIGPHYTYECPWAIEAAGTFKPVGHHLEKRTVDINLIRRFT